MNSGRQAAGYWLVARPRAAVQTCPDDARGAVGFRFGRRGACGCGGGCRLIGGPAGRVAALPCASWCTRPCYGLSRAPTCARRGLGPSWAVPMAATATARMHDERIGSVVLARFVGQFPAASCTVRCIALYCMSFLSGFRGVAGVVPNLERPI